MNTPGCSYGANPAASDPEAEFPPLFLSECTQPIPEGAVDLRGVWLDPRQPADQKGERIEQCGLRITFTGGGVVHDCYLADGTIASGVNDIDVYNCSKPIQSAGRFSEDGRTFSFFAADGSPKPSRTLLTPDIMQWYLPQAGAFNYTRAAPPPPPRRPSPRPKAPARQSPRPVVKAPKRSGSGK